MEELLTLNLFAYAAAAPLLGVLLFGGLLALPLYYDGGAHERPPAACCPQAS